MFSFLPQFLIIVSLAGIIIILFRHSPQVTVKNFRPVLFKLGQLILQYAKKLWHFILEVKEISKTKGLGGIQKTFPRLHFPRLSSLPRPTLRFFKFPDTVEYYLSQAQKSMEREDYGDAERKFIKAIEKDVKNEAAYAGLGKLYLAQKKFEDAVEIFKFLIKHYPENDGYYSSLGQAYHGQKLYDQAVEAYERAIEIDPNNARRYINLGLTLEAQKHLEEAILNYRKALSMEKENTQFMLVLAEALLKKGEREEVELLLEQILQVEPTNHLAREKLMQLKF